MNFQEPECQLPSDSKCVMLADRCPWLYHLGLIQPLVLRY